MLMIEERRERELLYKAERKKYQKRLELEEKKARDDFKKEKELRSYSYVSYKNMQV